MILVDTSIWIDHLRRSDEDVISLLRSRQVLMHPHIIGEIALGNFAGRAETIQNLARLRPAVVALEEEVLALVERERLFGTGIGYVDAHLLASAKLTLGASIWTRDRRLAKVARQLDVDAPLS